MNSSVSSILPAPYFNTSIKRKIGKGKKKTKPELPCFAAQPVTTKNGGDAIVVSHNRTGEGTKSDEINQT